MQQNVLREGVKTWLWVLLENVSRIMIFRLLKYVTVLWSACFSVGSQCLAPCPSFCLALSSSCLSHYLCPPIQFLVVFPLVQAPSISLFVFIKTINSILQHCLTKPIRPLEPDEEGEFSFCLNEPWVKGFQSLTNRKNPAELLCSVHFQIITS